MSDEEKIKWFNDTMNWVDQWGSSDDAREAVDSSSDAAFDLFFDVVDQYHKVTGK